MKKFFFNIFILAATILMVACQKDHYEPADMQVQQPDAAQFKGSLTNYDYTMTWQTPPQGVYMMYSIYRSGSQIQGFVVDTALNNSFTLSNVETGEPYEFVFKYCQTKDGSGPISKGTVINYTREGAHKVQNLTVSQVETETAGVVSNKVVIAWDVVDNATAYDVVITCAEEEQAPVEKFNGEKKQEEVSLEFPAEYGQKWSATVVAKNSDGIAIPTSSECLVGKTKNAFLSLYPTVESLMEDGDDDEICAWLFLHTMYPNMRYLYFGDVTAETLQPLRMAFFIRDVESGYDDVYNMPSVAVSAAPVIGEWVKNGGNLCLWSHAVVYIGTIGRFPADQFAGGPDAIGAGPGGHNGDVWKMAATIKTDGGVFVDNVNHPLYRGLRYEKNGDGLTLIPLKGSGWTEDHNCAFFDRPSWWTEEPNNSPACYDKLVKNFGVRPLGTWDSQAAWVSQLNVWEVFRPEDPSPKFEGNQYKGTILCIGNGGCEISMKTADGTIDATMSVNSEQDNINKMICNAVDYLMSK